MAEGAKLLDGKALAKQLRAELKEEVAGVAEKLGRPPGLAVVLVGEDPGSAVYVRGKERAAAKVGIHSEVLRLPHTASEGDILGAVDDFNDREQIDGFLVQLPLPEGIDQQRVTSHINPDKDADGLHPTNLGRLLAGIPAPRSCTPSGIMALLDAAKVELKGARAVVVGRSAIVGKPLALMLLERHATVTLCHSRTKDLDEEVRRAQVVVAAVGRPKLVLGDWIGQGAVVIDVGINRIDGQLVGDVDFEAALARAAHITPVPGGVGPMTIAMLLRNTVEIAKQKIP